jgi:starvation-inducible DNA-binding protein
MNELTTAIKVLLANATVMYYKAHQFHWNIEGIEFTQYHEFFGDLYTEVYGSIDPTAEWLRKLDDYAPVSLDELFKYKTLKEETTRVELLKDIFTCLIAANEEVLASLNKVFTIANSEKQQGVCNFIADRIDTHQKHAWFLRASAKKIG